MSEVSIRSATDADAEALAEIMRAAYEPWIARLPGLPDVSDGVAAEIAAHPAWIASDGVSGAVRGGIILHMSDDVPYIANLAVHPEAGGAGIGRLLVQRAENHATASGAGRIRLTTHRDMTPTLAFYERLGWRRTGGEGVRVFMEKNLP